MKMKLLTVRVTGVGGKLCGLRSPAVTDSHTLTGSIQL